MLVFDGQVKGGASVQPADASWAVDARATRVERVVLMVKLEFSKLICLLINESLFEENIALLVERLL